MARLDDLSKLSSCIGSNDGVTQRHSNPGEGCPTTAITLLYVELGGTSDENSGLANVTSSTDLITASLNANSRLGQPDTYQAADTGDDQIEISTPDQPDGRGLRLTRSPLHSRKRSGHNV